MKGDISEDPRKKLLIPRKRKRKLLMLKSSVTGVGELRRVAGKVASQIHISHMLFSKVGVLENCLLMFLGYVCYCERDGKGNPKK